MYLDYSKIPFDHFGRPETPTLFLQTLSGDTLGIIPGISNLSIRVKFSEPSEMDFDVAAKIEVGGELTDNPLYSELTGQRVIHTKVYGNYIIINPEDNNDGINDTVHIKAYSLEKHWEKKIFFLEEGTFNFWNPVDNEDTILGRMIELMPEWRVGYVSPSLIGKYRTFDQYDDYLLNFAYSTIPEKYRCVCVFDTYEKTISAYDVDEQYDTIPIYLDFDNLLNETSVNELTEELVTAISPYGEDDLDIRAVNPIGSNWIYNLDHFVINGDIPVALGDKWNEWQFEINNRRQMYHGLIGLKNSKEAQLIAERTDLIDMEGILTGYENQRSITIQARDMEITDQGKAYQEEVLEGINRSIGDQETAINEKKTFIEDIESEIESYNSDINDIISELKFTSYFTEEERNILSNYLIEMTLTESTFVSSDFSSSGMETLAAGSTAGEIEIMNSDITRIQLDEEYGKMMYTFEGGTLSHSGDFEVSGDIVRGTLEIEQDEPDFVFTAYMGALSVDDSYRSSGVITLIGQQSDETDNIAAEYDGDVVYYKGTEMSFNALTDTTLYVSGNVGEYEKYAVQLELYDYAVATLRDLASPAYEFSIQSGNFIFAQEFEAFRNQLQLGRGVHMNLGNGDVITPYLIELSVDFENHEQLDLVFSSRFKRHDQVNTLKEMIERSYSSSRSFEASKYTYNQTVNKQSEVDKFMSGELNAARNTILAAADQSVIIDGAGIRVNGNIRDGNTDKDIELRIVNGMIAMSDDNWNTAKLAIGYFKDTNGSHYGVNADVIAGKLLVGNNLVIENETDQGVMQFKVDQTGAWLYNSQLLLQSSDGGGIMIHPDYGFVVGGDMAHPLYTTSGTTVTPSFIDSQTGEVIDENSDGLPDNVNFYIDTEGNVSMKGNILADSGDIGGWIIDDNMLYSGSNTTYVALNTSGSNTTSAYAIWAGNENAGSAPFFVKRDGTVRMENGDFQGTISGGSININDNFIVDDNGNVTLNGNITWGPGTDRPVGQVYALYARTQIAKPTNAYNSYPATSLSGWHKTLDTSNDYFTSYSYDNGATWTDAIKTRGSDGTPGSGATVTRSSIVDAMLDAETQDGLYTYTINGNRYLGINATSINTGRISSANNNNNWWDLDTGELHVSGNSISITAGDNISTAINNGVATANSYTDTQLGVISDAIDDYLEEFEGLINGQMVTYYYDYEPSLQNIPASEWTQDGTESDHEGDLFFWKTTGRAYRFMEVDDEWVWQLIRDQDITRALESASNAQYTADNKMRVFTTTPTPPYDAGDLWLQGVTGDIMVCVYEDGRAEGAQYVDTDWEKRNKYTDDSAVDNLEIGGRNLLLKTGTSSTSSASSSESAYTGYWYYSDYGQECFEGNITDKFTLSFDYEIVGGAPGTSGTQATIYPMINGVSWGNAQKITANQTGHYVQSGVLKSSQATYASDFRLRVRLQYAANGSTIKVSNLKLEKGTKATDWTPAPEDVQESVNALYTWKDTTYASTVQSITGQLDRKIETWYRATNPALDPNNDWDNSEHIGDIWFNSSTGTTSQWDGASWNEMTSNPPASVFSTINKKKQIFVSEPVPPYEIGDLWVQGSGGDILRCSFSRSSGDYVRADWVAASKYTDDTTANAAYELAQSSISSVDVEYAKNQSNTTAPTSGWSTNAPEWQSGYYIWQRTATTLASGYVSYSTALCITGVKGDPGNAGTGVSSTEITYQASSSGTITPTGTWRTTIPSVTKGSYLWTRTTITYTNNTTSTSYSVAYIGTDGDDGNSVFVQSVSKSNGVTTVTLSDGTTTSNLTINDGEEGPSGTPGANGYIHVAWATSADGSQGFDTTESEGKTYIGVYTDNTEADSQTYSDYSWSLIKGEDGVGITSIVEQYYLSTSNTTQTGSSWSNTCPEYQDGRYYWTRSYITWDDNTTSTTAPILAGGINSANEAIGNLELGARNLLLNTAASKTSASSSSESSYTDYWYFSEHGQNIFKDNTTDNLTISFDYEITGGTPGTTGRQAYIYPQINGYSWGTVHYITENETGHYAQSGVLKSTQASYASDFRLRVRLQYAANGSTVKISNIKLERGTKATDWTPAPEDVAAELAEINNWISTDFESTINDIRGQIDGKADTYYQATDPSNEWDSGTELGHKGDLWYDTTEEKSKIWTGTDWAESDVPDAVYDKIDGKAQVFVGETTPTGATAGDLWFKGINEPIFTYVNNTWVEYNKYTDDSAVNKLVFGGRNLMINTLVPDVSAASKRPMILGQGVNTATSGSTALTTADHGVRLTTTSAVYPWLRFGSGSNDIASGTMIGLKAGQTYTLSFDTVFKLYSGTPSTSTSYTYRMVLYYATSTATSWSSKAYPIYEYSTSDISDRGTVISKRAEITFEIPSSAAKCYIIIRPSSSTNGHFAVGDYFELSNLQLERGTKASDWSPAPEDLEAYTNGQLDTFANTVAGYVDNLQAQIDGQIETYYYDYEPTLSNVPASAWTTADDKAAHEGDLFFWKSKGYAYRFMNDNNTWKWTMVQDTDITLALTNAATAQDTADAKRRVFTAQPTTPYDVGDLWTQGSTGDIMTCTRARASGSYTASDWSKLNKYTDDSALNTFMTGAYATTISNIQGQIDKKVDTWYQTTDPSTSWSATEKTEHKGDLWYNSTASVQKYYRWSGSAWQELTATPPSAVFDRIDGKAQIYIGATTPSSPSEGDLWLKGTNDPILSYVNGQWVEYNKYTDDSAVDNLVIGGGNILRWSDFSKCETITSNYDWVTGGFGRSSGGNATVSLVSINDAPVPVSTAFRFTGNTTGNKDIQQRYIPLEENTDYTFSAYIRIINGTTANILSRYWDRTGNKAVKSTTTELTGTGWQRWSITKNTGTMTDGKYDFSLGVADASADIEICAPMLEKGTKVTSWGLSSWDRQEEVAEINNWIEVDFQETINEVLGQIDGKADTWYQNADPSTTPSPGWNTSDLKAAHEGDLWYCTDSTNTARYKKVWRWTVTNNTYSWQEMSSVPDDVFDQIDGRAQIFTGATLPSGATPNEGDLWLQGADEPILTYINGSWIEYNKYTDNTALEAGFGNDNLLLDTYATSLTKVNAVGNRYFSDSSNSGTTGEFIEITGLPDPNATCFIRLSNSSGTGARAYTFYSNNPPPILDGHYYSISCYARSTTGPTTLRLRFSGNTGCMKDFTVSDTWEKYEYTAKFIDSGSTADSYKRTYFYFRPTDVGQSLDMCGFRLRDVTDDVMKSQVVNDNLLPRTKDFATWSRYSNVALERDPTEDGINMFHYPAVETVAYRDVTNNQPGLAIPYEVVRDQTVTLSYWVKTSTADTITSNAYVVFSLTTAPASGRIKYSSNQVPSYVLKQTTDWQKVVFTTTITDALFTSGSGTITEDLYFFIQFYNHSLVESWMKKPKLEFGSIDTEWCPRKADDLQGDGRNLLRNSALSLTSSTTYNIAVLYFGDERPIVGESYVLQIKGTLGSDRVGWGVYNSGGTVDLGNYNGDYKGAGPAFYNETTGIYTIVIPSWRIVKGNTTAANNRLFLYQMLREGTSASSIEWVKLEKGTVPTAWSPAPEDIDEKIDNIEIGGKNLLLDTNAPSLTAIAATNNRYFSDSSNTTIVPTYISVTDAPINVSYGAQFVSGTATSTDAGRRLAWYSGATVPMVDGQEYTMSAYAKVTSGTTMRLLFQYGVSSYPREHVDITNTEWKQYSWTFTYSASGAGDSAGTGARVYIGSSSYYAGTVQMCGFQLERGNKVSDWSPAPEDLEHIAKEAQEAADAAQGAADAAQSSANSALSRFGTCTIAAGTAAKVVTCPTFTSLTSGATINVLFTNTNTVANPTLDVNSTGAKGIRYYVGTTRTALTATSYYNWIANSTVTFRYDGEYWIMQDSNSLMDQTATFNRLTKGQTNQGIYLDNGNVYVNATYINAGYISADRIDINTITADHIATDAITADKILAGEITSDKISSDGINADKIWLYGMMEVHSGSSRAGVVGGSIGYGQGNDGTYTTSGIKLSDPSGTYYIIATESGVRMTANGATAGKDIYVSNSGPSMRYNANNKISVTSTGPIIQYNANNKIYVTTDGPRLYKEGYEVGVNAGTFVPISYVSGGNKNITLGSQTYKWTSVWSETGTIQTSDRAEKKDISYDMSKYIELFDALKPANYKMINGTSDRTHTGFVAQDIKESLQNLGMSTVDFACFIKDKNEETGEDVYALRYEELIALLTAKIQQQQKQIDDLETRISNIE